MLHEKAKLIRREQAARKETDAIEKLEIKAAHGKIRLE